MYFKKILLLLLAITLYPQVGFCQYESFYKSFPASPESILRGHHIKHENLASAKFYVGDYKFGKKQEGKKIIQIKFNRNGKITNYWTSSNSQKYKFVYNKNLLSKMVIYGEKGSNVGLVKFIYENDLLVEEQQIDANGDMNYKTEYEYNSEGQLHDKKEYEYIYDGKINKKEKLSAHKQYLYNKRGWVKQLKELDVSSDKVQNIRRYKYKYPTDNKVNLTIISNGKRELKRSFKVDDKNQIIEVTTLNKLGEPERYTKVVLEHYWF